jgi:hypothetical protein
MNSDRAIAVTGYTLTGATVGYIVGSVVDNESKWTLIGSLLGLSTGMIRQYELKSVTTKTKGPNGEEITAVQGKDGLDTNTSVAKTLLTGFVGYKLAIPLLGLGIVTAIIVGSK